MIKKLNNFLLFVFLLTLATGSTLFLFNVGSFSLFAFRIVVFIIPVILVINKTYYKPGSNIIADLFLLLLVLFFVYAVFSYLSVTNKVYAAKAILYWLTVIFMTFSLLSFARYSENFFKVFTYAWVSGFAINTVIAVYEIATGSHLVSEYSLQLYTYHPGHFIQFIPASLFGNPNHFAIYLIHSLIIFVLFRKYLPANLLTLLVTVTVVLCYFTYSNLALVSLSFPFLYWIYNERKAILNSLNKNYLIPALTIVLIIVSIFLFNNTINPRKDILTEYKNTTTATPKSSDIRTGLINEGIKILKDNNGMGIGAGQFQHYLETNEEVQSNAGVTSPHSAILETTVEYGLPFMLLIIIFWAGFGLKLILDKKFKFFRIYLIYSFSIIFLSNANSGFISSPVSWLLLILPVVFINREEESFC